MGSIPTIISLSLLLLAHPTTTLAAASGCPLAYIPGSSQFSQPPDKLLGLQVWTNENAEITTIKAWFLLEQANLEIPKIMGDPQPTGKPTVTTDLWKKDSQIGCVELGHNQDGALVSLAYCVQLDGLDSICESVGPLGNVQQVEKLKLTCLGVVPTKESVSRTIQGT
jgi:hypothetical protein